MRWLSSFLLRVEILFSRVLSGSLFLGSSSSDIAFLILSLGQDRI